jgi:hypothetical protein
VRQRGEQGFDVGMVEDDVAARSTIPDGVEGRCERETVRIDQLDELACLGQSCASAMISPWWARPSP